MNYISELALVNLKHFELLFSGSFGPLAF